jgi:hypothetical protein
MDKLGDWIRLLAVAAAYGVAFVLFQRVMPFSLESPWFVCVAMVCFLGLAFTAHAVVSIRMPRSLRAIREWEARGGFYQALGVPVFGMLLRRTPLRLFNRDVYLGVGARDFAELSARLEAAEAAHFWAAVLVVPYMVCACVLGLWSALFWVSIVQVLVNAYPVMHLRMARSGLDRLVLKRSSHRDRSGAA